MNTLLNQSDESFIKIGSVWSASDLQRNDNDGEIEELEPENTWIIDEQTQDALSIVRLSEQHNQQANNREESDEVGIFKIAAENCTHHSKNFKLCKKRLRCGDCGATACSECYTIVPTTLSRHFANLDDKRRVVYPCDLCDLIFRSQCALQAHIRVHILSSPYVCPDCGVLYSSMYFLAVHLINKCYHVYRVVRHKCSSCYNSYPTADLFLEHIRKNHMKPMFRCPDCIKMFTDMRQVQTHSNIFHKDKATRCEALVRCALCPSLYIPKHKEMDHVQVHRYDFAHHQFTLRCPCGQFCSTPNVFRAHLSVCKKRGVLPAHWSFLQTTIKTHEVQKSDRREGSPSYCLGCDCRIDFLNDSSGFCEKCYNEEEEYNAVKITLSNSRITFQKNMIEDSSGCSYVIEAEDGESSKDTPSTYSEANDEITDSNDCFRETESEPIIQRVCTSDVQLVEEYPKEPSSDAGVASDEKFAVEDDPLESKEEKPEPEGERMAYKSIPEDHVGYLRKYKGNEEEESRYRTQVFLDERSGLMKTQKVEIETIEIDDDDENVTTEMYIRSNKVKKTNVFNCPFCVVTFPKHDSLFQLFSVHMEYYHPDSCLDINVEESPKSPPRNVVNENDLPTKTNAEKNKKVESRRKSNLSADTESTNQSTNDVPDEEIPKEADTSVYVDEIGDKKDKAEDKTEKPADREKEPEIVDEEKPAKKRKETSSESNSDYSRTRRKAKETAEEPQKKEREVWEEFYESLAAAEKRKKPEEGMKVPSYSSKRVVKKPKRYDDGSDAEDGNVETETKDESFKVASEVEKSQHKDKLMKKLKKVDRKIVDYLCNLLDKSDKKYQLLQKHSNLRFGKNQRDYRKEVLNGIKNQTRPKYSIYKDARPKDGAKEEAPKEVDKTATKCPATQNDSVLKKNPPRNRSKRSRLSDDRMRLSDYDKEVSFIEKNFEREETSSSSNKRKRKLSSKLLYYKKINKEKDEFSSGQVIAHKSSETGKKLICSVCEETYQTELGFREHVVSHRTDEAAYQCMECGECFVVRPSLTKHLHAFHKIKDIEKYIKDNNCYYDDKDEDDESEPLKENQCKVCKDQFESSGDLSKHFRIHGMAFLKEVKKDGKNC